MSIKFSKKFIYLTYLSFLYRFNLTDLSFLYRPHCVQTRKSVLIAFPMNLHQKSECVLERSECGRIGHGDKKRKSMGPGNKTKRSQNAFAVTCIALTQSSLERHPRVEWRGLTTFARHNKLAFSKS